MPTTTETWHQAKLDRFFKLTTPGLDGQRVTLNVTPNKVKIPGVGLVHWHDAERYAQFVLETARAARVLGDMADQDPRADPANICSKCHKTFDGEVVKTENGVGGFCHVEGSPACVR